MGPSAAAVPSSATTPIKRPCERRKSVPLLAAAGTDTVIAELDHLTLGEITRQAAVRSALSNRHCDSTGPDRTLATGFSDILAEVSGKLVDVARELNKSQSSISYLWHTDWPDRQHRHILTREAAEKTGLELRSSGITNIGQLNDALITIKQRGATAFIVQPSPFTYAQRGQIIAAAIKYGLGTIFAFPAAAREGSLIVYGPDYLQMYSRAPIYVDRIIKGSKPADLPVEQPTKVELLVNLQTAKTLGIEVPLALLLRADELLE
jgi:putative ABC transport system substrate-binding protein